MQKRSIQYLTMGMGILCGFLLNNCAMSLPMPTPGRAPSLSRLWGSGMLVLETEADTLWVPGLRAEAIPWLGVPYLWGGTSLEGVDCSAFVRSVYEKARKIHLPRTAQEQSKSGWIVSLNEMRPGDLVFFGLVPGSIEHVGIYWDEGWFINATVSRGVAFSHLSEKFWSARVRFARRMEEPAGIPLHSLR